MNRDDDTTRTTDGAERATVTATESGGTTGARGETGRPTESGATPTHSTRGVAVGGPVVLQAIHELGPQARVPVAATNVILAVVGLLVAYHALRAYGRNEDRSILLFGGGLFLLTTVQAVVTLSVLTIQSVFGLVSPLLAGLDIGLGIPLGFVFAGASELLDLVGLAAIFYALVE